MHLEIVSMHKKSSLKDLLTILNEYQAEKKTVVIKLVEKGYEVLTDWILSPILTDKNIIELSPVETAVSGGLIIINVPTIKEVFEYEEEGTEFEIDFVDGRKIFFDFL